jgi:hypothetical protein
MRGEEMTVSELVAAVTALGIPLGARPNKAIADAVRWEILRNHVRRTGRGRYAVGRLPVSTEHYMRVRVERYAIDRTQAYSRPDNYPRLSGEST